MNIEHISISRSKLYKECPHRYKLKYHLKVPNPEAEPFYFTYGKIIHKVAEVYVQEKAGRSLGEISSDVLRGKIEFTEGVKAPPLPSDYQKRLPGHLRAIKKITDSMGVEGETEKNFKYDLQPPNSKLVTGVIDRLLVKGDKAFILDYKTTKKGPFRETKDTILRDPQLRCYARVVNRDYGIPAKNITAALYYLEDGELIAATYSQQSLYDIEKELLEVYDSIAGHDPDKVFGYVGQHCNRCEYREQCVFFRNQQQFSWDGNMDALFNSR